VGGGRKSGPHQLDLLVWGCGAVESISSDTMILRFKFDIASSKKIQNKIMDVHKICVYSLNNFENPIWNTLRETKKTNPT
jgi:hypothetical protein